MTTFRDLIIDRYTETPDDYPTRIYLEDVVNYGCANGTGPIYTAELNRIYDDHEDEILDIIQEYTGENPFEFIADTTNPIHNLDDLRGRLVWLAWELEANNILDDPDQEFQEDQPDESEEDNDE